MDLEFGEELLSDSSFSAECFLSVSVLKFLYLCVCVCTGMMDKKLLALKELAFS